MRVTSALLVLFLVFTTACVAERAQEVQDNRHATTASTQTDERDEATPKPDTRKTQDNEWLAFEPTTVELKGKLIIKMYYGPPNFGENPDTDDKQHSPILLLSKPVNVGDKTDHDVGSERGPVEDVREMHLVLRMPFKPLIGKTVIVNGTLFRAETGHHHTDVLMDVKSIRRAEAD